MFQVVLKFRVKCRGPFANSQEVEPNEQLLLFPLLAFLFILRFAF